MNKTKRILLTVFCILLVLLLVSLFVAAGVSVAKNGAQGLVGELLSGKDRVTDTDAVTESEIPDTQEEQDDMMELLFDLDKIHRPSYRDMYELYKLQESGADLLITDAVEIMGKPHDYGSFVGNRFFEWELDNGNTCTIYTGSHDEKYKDQPTPWDAMLTEGYGGAYVGRISYAGGSQILDDTLFDVDMLYKPAYEDYFKIEEGMTITEIVEILGKPHGIDAAAGSKFLWWEFSHGDRLSVKAIVVKGEETYTDWNEILTENYGGAVCDYYNYYGSNMDGK